MLTNYQWHIFWVICTTISVVLVLRLRILMPLYTNPDFRSRTQALIQATAAREGWLLSGISIDHISQDNTRLLYRSFLRGEDPQSCYNVSLTTGTLSSCDDF